MDCSLRDGSSKLTLRSSFFDNLWPLIIDDNICDIESKSHSWYFQPTKPFDQLHWHKFLAGIGYPDYVEPYELRCCKAEESEVAANEAAELDADKAAEALAAKSVDVEENGSVAIVPIDKQIDALRLAHERRQKLAYDFANRKYPWTMQRPSFEIEFVITDKLLEVFKKPMEREILQAIQLFDIKLMIIDAGAEICFSDFHRWIKFRPYVQMVALVRCHRVERQLQLMEGIFKTVIIEESGENSWHEELECSLHTGFRYARTHEMQKNCSDAFVFVFSNQRGICTCNAFRVLRLK